MIGHVVGIAVVGARCHDLLKNSLCLGRGSNRRPFDLKSSTLIRRCESRLVPTLVSTTLPTLVPHGSTSV